MRYRSWAALLVALGVGAAAGWFAHGDKKTAARAPDFAPPGATVLDSRALRAQSGPSQVAVAWRRGDPNDYPTEFGLTIWQKAAGGRVWRRLYERRVPFSKLSNIHDLRLHTADVTRDGREDLLVYEDFDGSAGVYVYRLLTTEGGKARQIAARRTSEDDTTVFAQYGELISYDGIGKDPKTALSIHCCPLYWQRTVKTWNGQRLVTARVARTKRRPALPY